MKTMNISGNKYAKVVDRLKEFRNDRPKAKITTSYEIIERGFVFFARLEDNGVATTGHSFGTFGKPKSLEKAETIAVGRALAFFGYFADGEISSYEEQIDFQKEDEQFNARLKNLIYNVENLLETDDLVTPEQEQAIRQLFDTENFDALHRNYLGLLEIKKEKQIETNPSAAQRNQKVLDKLNDPKA